MVGSSGVDGIEEAHAPPSRASGGAAIHSTEFECTGGPARGRVRIVAISIATDAATLALSRFATSPAAEVVATLRARRGPAQGHVRHWYARALARLDAETMNLLHALVPDDHPYVPDFLTPHPRRAREDPGEMAEAIASATEKAVGYELDFAFQGRAVHPEFVATFGGRDAYLRWRRQPPDVLAALIDAGERAVVDAAADAMGRFFDAAIADQWPQVVAVLEADIAFRAETMATGGIATMLETLSPDLTWNGSEVTLPRPYDVYVDWADDGLLLIPCTAHQGPLLFVAERPRTPTLVYSARGTAPLWTTPPPGDTTKLATLIGRTRLALLLRLEQPRTTQDLSRLDGHSPATVSYHLGVLHGSRLVTAQRSGRGVLYRRTALGDALVNGDAAGLVM
jgi:DNA-binding transcriptional ArsR family regulator